MPGHDGAPIDSSYDYYWFKCRQRGDHTTTCFYSATVAHLATVEPVAKYQRRKSSFGRPTGCPRFKRCTNSPGITAKPVKIWRRLTKLQTRSPERRARPKPQPKNKFPHTSEDLSEAQLHSWVRSVGQQQHSKQPGHPACGASIRCARQCRAITLRHRSRSALAARPSETQSAIRRIRLTTKKHRLAVPTGVRPRSQPNRR